MCYCARTCASGGIAAGKGADQQRWGDDADAHCEKVLCRGVETLHAFAS